MPLRKAHEALTGDVFSGKNGMFMVRDVEIRPDAVSMQLAAGRTDAGEWYDFPPDADVSLWREGDRVETKQVPRTVQDAIAAFEDVEKTSLAFDRANIKHRSAVLKMALDEDAKDWQAFYQQETERITSEYEEKPRKSGTR